MHPLHDYIAGQLAERLKAKRIVVWHDPRRVFAPFVKELHGGARPEGTTVSVNIAGVTTHLADYAGSMSELRMAAEPWVCSDKPQNLLVYLPGCTRKIKTAPLLELEKASEVDGSLFRQSFKKVARQVLRKRYTCGVVDDLTSENLTYEDIVRVLSDSASSDPASQEPRSGC